MQPIYLDNGATTPIDPRVIQKMTEVMTQDYGNPASRSHPYGWRAESLVNEARQNVAALINAHEKEIVFTSGATESINLALKGAAHFYQEKGRHIITLKTEHKATLDTCRQLEAEGFSVTYLPVKADGLVDMDVLKAAIQEDTILLSILHGNNEIGVLQGIAAIAKLAREKGILLHVDAAQTAGKVDIDVAGMGIDLLSLSGHKMYGPKGIGALYVCRRPRVRLAAQMHGGGHERGFRSGTLPTHQIVGLGEACKIAKAEMQAEAIKTMQLRDRLYNGIRSIEEVHVNGSLEHRLPGNLNVSINFVEGESLIMGLKDLAISSGSACTSASLEPSYVLRALGRSDELAHSSLRFGIGRFTTEAEIDKAIVLIKDVVARLRELSPLWEMHQEGIDLATVEWAAH